VGAITCWDFTLLLTYIALAMGAGGAVMYNKRNPAHPRPQGAMEAMMEAPKRCRYPAHPTPRGAPPLTHPHARPF
jgi:hypothetical protein